MSKRGVKHRDEVLREVVAVLESQNGIMTHENVVNILKQYYSETFSEQDGQAGIVRELSKQGIAKLVKVKLPNADYIRHNKHAQKNPPIGLLVSTKIPADQKQAKITEFLRSFLPKVIPPLKRSVSKEILVDALPKIQKRVETIDFPSVKFRAMLLHYFLVTTFPPGMAISSREIAMRLPIHLSLQIIRGFDFRKEYPHLAIIEPLSGVGQFELDMIIPYLKPPYQTLVNPDNTVNPTARFEIPHLGISKLFDFVNDVNAYSDYWILLFSLLNERVDLFPVSIMGRFQPILTRILAPIATYSLPFFPRQVERIAHIIGVTPDTLAYTLQRLFKIRLRDAQCMKDTFLDVKLFPASGIISYIVSGKSALAITLPELPRSFSTEFEVKDSSLRSLAKLYAASRLTDQGYIQKRRSNFDLFKKQVEKWIEQSVKTTNVVTSWSEDPIFLSLTEHEMGKIITTMRFPIKKEAPVFEEEEEYTSDNNEIEIMRSKSARFAMESERILPSILCNAQQPEPATRNMSREDFNEIFSSQFPTRTMSAPTGPYRADSSDGEYDSEEEKDAVPEDDDDEEEEIGFEMDEMTEVTLSELIEGCSIGTRIRDAPFHITVAMEFIKAVLGSPPDGEGTDYLRVRQLAHIPTGDISKALWYLTGCGIYQNTWKMALPRNKWSLIPFDKSVPFAIHIPLCESQDPPVAMHWELQEKTRNQKLGWAREEMKWNWVFEWTKLKHALPSLPPVDTPSVEVSCEYDGDPLGHFTFGKYEENIHQFEDFERRYIMNMVNSGGTDGVPISSILNGLCASSRQHAEHIMSTINDLCACGVIVRVPSSQVEPRYSRFIPVNTLYKKAADGIELVPVHIWSKWDGDVASDVKRNTRSNITTYVFAHEFCSFEELMDQFCYISPLDLCMLLDSLECDGILFSQYFNLYEATILEEERRIPVASFADPELFLALIDRQKKNGESPRLLRLVRTTKDALTILSNVKFF